MTAEWLSVAGNLDPFAKLPALAERLGVSEAAPDAPASVLLHTGGGQVYDLFDLINAALDRLEGKLSCPT